MRKGYLATIGGILTALGGLPTLATNLHLALPLWWNGCTGTLNLLGLLGVVVLGYVAKGADDHSTPQQIAAAGAQKAAEVQVQTANATTPIEKVEVVNPPAVKGVIVPLAKKK